MTPTATPAAPLDLAAVLQRLQRMASQADGLLLAPAPAVRRSTDTTTTPWP